MKLTADLLAFHNKKMERVVEAGSFKLWIAEHAQDTRHEFDFTVEE